MEDLARAAGLSRQSLYKKFGSKEAILDWAMEEAIKASFEAANQALGNRDKTPIDRLADAFDRWTGDHVLALRGTAHGSEILEMAVAHHRDNGLSADDAFNEAVIGFLMEQGYAQNQQQAEDGCFALTTAGKGLLLKSATPEQFRQGMERIIRVFLCAAE